MTPYEEFRIYAISQHLDPKIADPLRYAPKLASIYPKDKLFIALAMIHDDFTPKGRTVDIKPIIYSVLKFEAYSADKFVNVFLNDALGDLVSDSLEREITHRIDRIFSEQIA